MIQSRLTVNATDKNRGMTLEELRTLMTEFERHMCSGAEFHVIEVGIGWHKQIQSMTVTCEGTPT